MTVTIGVLALLALVVAFVLATVEAALLRVSRVRSEEMAEEGKAGARSLVTVMTSPNGAATYISVVAFLRVLAESSVAVLVTFSASVLVDGTWQTILLSIGIMVIVSFVFVGVSPRTLGRLHHDSVARLAAPVLVRLRPVLGPVARVLVWVGNAVTPGEGFRNGPFATESELRDLVDLAGETSLIEDAERDMIHSVFELGDTLTREVMVPRTEMVTIEADRSLRSATSLFLRSGFSRIPVIGEDSDDVLGLLYFKDVVERTAADSDAGRQVHVEAVMRPMGFVPDSKPVDALLREMQRDQTHLAIVVDEYGGTAGLVTIEDVLEEIVGEIEDEYDREAPGLEDLGEGRVRVPATMDIDDLAEHYGVEIDEEEVETVGGLLTKLLGRVAIPGNSAEIEGLRLVAERMAGRRHQLATVVVERVHTEDDGDEHEEQA